MSTSSYTNCELLPSSVQQHPWLYEQNEEQMRKNGYGDACGKWMMYWNNAIFDQKWAEARQLYREGKLEGIHSMKCSTACGNERASDPNSGIIIFYCGPATDEERVMQIGQKLLEQIPYRNHYGAMFYKSDALTTQGTRATGNRRNHDFRIPVTKTEWPKAN